MTQTNLVTDCIPFGLLQTDYFWRRYKFQNVAIETISFTNLTELIFTCSLKSSFNPETVRSVLEFQMR